METTVTPIQTTVVSGGPQARGNATMIKLESKEIRRERRVREGGEENYPAVAGRGLQGRAQPGRASAMEAEGGSQGMGCQGRRSGHSYAGQFQQTCHASYPSGSLFLRKPHCSNQRLNLLRYSLSHLGKKVNGIV